MQLLYSFTDLSFWLFFLYFFLVLIPVFYIPGSVVLKREKWSPLQYVVLSVTVGLVLWALQGVLFGYGGVRWMTYLYLFGMLVLWLRNKKYQELKTVLQEKWHIDRVLLFLVLIGTAIQVISVWFIGYKTSEGLAFCCFWPDSFYHLALINELVRSFPPTEPGMSGEAVRNYHYLANLVIAELSRVFRLPVIPTQYQYMPVFLSLLLGGGVISFARAVYDAASFKRWLVFFMYFSGDIIFLLLFAMGNGWDFSVTVSENATTLWFSPPRFYALVIFFSALTLFVTYTTAKKQTLLSGVLLGVLLGSLTGFKIYIAFLALCGLGFVVIYGLIRKRFHYLIPFITAGLISAVLYLPTNTGAGGLFYSGLWRIDDFAIRPAFGLMQFELAKQVYLQHNNFIRVFLIESFYFILFFFSLFGMFLLGFFQTKKSIRLFPIPLHIALLSGLTVSFIIGILFLQKTGGANTLQFLFSVYIVGSIYAALAVSNRLDKIKRPFLIPIIVLLIILISFRVVRDTYFNITDIQKKVGYYIVTPPEQEALMFLRNDIPQDAIVGVEHTIAFEDSCYILSVIAERGFFLCGSGILEDHGVPVQKRSDVVRTIFTDTDVDRVAQALRENNISYLYVSKDFLFGTNQSRDFLRPVFENENVTILKVENEKMPQ